MKNAPEQHAPLPWTFRVLDTGEELIIDAEGGIVHMEPSYYPSGLATADARLICDMSRRIAELENLIRRDNQPIDDDPMHGVLLRRVMEATGFPATLSITNTGPIEGYEELGDMIHCQFKFDLTGRADVAHLVAYYANKRFSVRSFTQLSEMEAEADDVADEMQERIEAILNAERAESGTGPGLRRDDC